MISERIFLPPALINSAIIQSVFCDLCIFSFSIATSTSKCWFQALWTLLMASILLCSVSYAKTHLHDCRLLPCKYLRTALFWVITQQVIVISFRLQKDSWTLSMRPISCPKTSVRNYHNSLCNNPDELSSQKHTSPSNKTLFNFFLMQHVSTNVNHYQALSTK